MSVIDVGIDPEAARRLATSWSDTGLRCAVELDAARAQARAVLVADGPLDDSAVTGLALAAALLLDRASAIAGIGWASPLGDTTGWSRLAGWGRWTPGDQDDDWIDAGRDAAYLELITWLAAGPRGSVVRELADPTEAQWRKMVERRTVWDGARTVRYLDIEPDPGAGIVVVDFFIPEDDSFFLDGDGRKHADPVFGSLTAGESRTLMVFDLETGRASIQLDDTCTMVGGCNAARPITLDGSPFALDERGSIDIANRVQVDSGEGMLTVDYDILNGIIAFGSTDGLMRLRNRGDGRYEGGLLFADEYPSVSVYQYLPGQRRRVVARQDSQGVGHLIPGWPELADLPDLPDLPDPPDIPLSAPDGVPDIEFEGSDLPDGPDLPDLPNVGGLDLPDLPDLPDLSKLPSFDLVPDLEGHVDLDHEEQFDD